MLHQESQLTDDGTGMCSCELEHKVLPLLINRDALGSLFLGQESCNGMTFVKSVISIQDNRLIPPATQ